MKCQVCGNEMKAGKISGRTSGLYWLPNEEEVGFFLSDNIIKKHKGIVLIGCNEFYKNRAAYVCEQCRKIVINY